MPELNDHFRDTLLDHVLAAPDIDLIQKACAAQETVDGVSLDSLVVSDDEAGLDNSREVRSVDRDLDGAKKAVSSLADDVAESVLLVPFEKALTVARSVGMTFDDWSPEHWLDRLESLSDQKFYERAARVVVRTIDPNDALPWFTAINAHAPWANQLGSLWMEVLAGPGAREPDVNATVGRMVDAYLDNDALAEPLNARAKDDTASSVRSVKLRALQKLAFQAFYLQNSSALGDHVWKHHGMDLSLLKWDSVIDNMVRELSSYNNHNRDRPFQPIDDAQIRRITQWVTRLTDTGHLDAWLARPDQWTAVECPAAWAQGTVSPRSVANWMNEHVNAGTFTWTVLVTGMNAMNQPGVAQEFKRLGERWSLTHEAGLIAQNAESVVRERVRL